MANLKLYLGNTSKSLYSGKDYIYQDVNSNFLMNSTNTDIVVNQDINAIFGSLRNIFNYTPGERMLNPKFGVDLRGLLYEPMNDQTASSIGLAFYNAINDWESRIKIKNINVESDEEDHTYYVTLTFTCKQLKINEDQQLTHKLRQIL